MSGRPPTPEQQRAIEGAGLDLCVVAGAGTGKTFTLTQRIVRRVVGAGVPLPRILAITFTEKAAAEMKERLAAALEAAGRSRAREEVEGAAISTVHAFCARMLREHAVAAGVDPGFSVLDELESERLLRDALDRLVDDVRESAPDDYALLASLGGADPAETLLRVYREAQASGSAPGDFVRRVPGLPPAAGAMAEVRAAVTALADLRGAGTPGTQEVVERTWAAGRALPPDDADPGALDEAVESVRAAVRLNVGKNAKGALERVRSAAEAALTVVAEHAMAPLRDALARAVERLDDLYDEAKGRGESLDFADLERAAVALLERRPDVRDAVRLRWREVLVDEFQDTNPVQARLVELLRSPGALFVVGDPKQAIYGFRGADVRVFREHLAAVEEQGRGGVVHLRHSHRSRPEVLGFVNHLFRDGVGGAGAGTDVALVAHRTWAPAAGPCVEIASFACDRMPEGREAEAAWIADRIAALCDGTFRIAAPAPEDPLRTRPAEWGDVAVLLRATTHVKALEQALVARDVPYLVVKGRGFFRAREVIDFARLVQCVDDPRDDLALASVLRSPACGVSDDGLFLLAAARRRTGDSRADPTARDHEPLCDVLLGWASGERPVAGLDEADVAALRGFARALADLRSRRGTDGVAALVDRAFARFRLDVLALARPNGRQRAANLRKVRALAREADRDGVPLAEFVRELRELREREVREAEAAVAGGARGAVSLMTVHAAKGLEFPVVFVPDAAREERSTPSEVVADARAGLGLRRRDVSASGAVPWSHRTITEARQAAERAESERLLYVAATRASDHLVFTGALRRTSDPSGDSRVWWRRIAGAVPLHRGAEDSRDEGAAEGAADAGDSTEPAGSPDSRDEDVGPGADSAGATRTIVRVHRAAAASGALPAAPRTLLGRRARDLAAGAVPALDLRPEAREEADRLLAEAARTAPPPDGTPFAVNVSALTAFARCPQEYRLRTVVGVPEDAASHVRPFAARTAFDTDESVPDDAERAGDDEPDVAPDVRALGRAVHAALERLVPAFTGDVRAEVEAALRAETGGAAPDPADVARLAAWIEAFRASEPGRSVAAVARADVRREQAFLLRSGRTTVRGQIDLLWRDPSPGGGWTVLDYKTGAAERPREEHALQMRLYALGVAGVTGEVPARLLLWSLPHGRAVPVTFTPEDRTGVDALLAEFADRTARRDFRPPASPPCAGCRVRHACRFAAVADSAGRRSLPAGS